MRYAYLIVASLIVCGAAMAQQNVTISERELRDPKQLGPWLQSNASDAETRIAAVETGGLTLSGYSVLGRASATTGTTAAITAGTDHFVLRRSGASIGFGLLLNANLDPAAAIAHTKLADVEPGYVLVGNAASQAVAVAVSGDIAMSDDGAASLSGDALAAVNGIIDYLADGLWTIATLANSDTPNKFKTTTTSAYSIGGITYTKTATDDLEFSHADTINDNGATNTLYGGWVIQINAAGTVSTLAETGQSGVVDQEHESAALALAAAQAITPAAANAVLGYLVIAYDATGEGDEGGTWAANTTDLTTNATTTWTDGDIKTLPTKL